MLNEYNIVERIIWFHRKKVLLDRDLAQLYGVSTKRLNEQVKRNLSCFAEEFMFQLTLIEKREVVANCDCLKTLHFSPNLPYAFTEEHGAVMLASVINSETANSGKYSNCTSVFFYARNVVKKQAIDFKN